MQNSELIMVHIIIAASSILIGVLGKFLRPKEPNALMGYRTIRSMKSQATWKFANEYAGNLMAWSALTSSKTIETGDVFRIPSGDLDITLN